MRLTRSAGGSVRMSRERRVDPTATTDVLRLLAASAGAEAPRRSAAQASEAIARSLRFDASTG